MIGDQDDMTKRLSLTLPRRWFADEAPVLRALLSGLAASWSFLFDLLSLMQKQSRLSTAAGSFLDLAAIDFFGVRFWRRASENDDSFRPRLAWAMQRTLVTRDAVTEVAAQAGYSLAVFEPAQPRDTGAYNVPVQLAWNMSGGWGSMEMPLEALITATPQGSACFEDELRAGIAAAMPVGGAAWLRVQP